jgi:hypothetical protein
MKFWDQIISSASLGTSKAPITSQHLPSYLQDQIPALPATDVEEEFLMIASIASQYRVGGHLPFTVETEALVPAQEEVQSQVSAKASSILNAVLAEDLLSLIHLWLRLCHQNRLCVAPDALPAVLELGSKRKELRNIIRAVIGNRGEWLCQLNPAWHFYISSMEADTMWQTGTPEERKEIIRALRITNPERAIDLMKSTWDTEGAQEKAVFLELLRINLSAQDLPWLQSLKEKGQKVNSLIQDLLKSIPGSQVVESYWSVLREHTRIKSSKALLGMMNKTTLEVDEDLQVPEEIFKSGIEKLSSSKNITDHQHITYQLIAGIPPSYWNNHFKESGKVIIELFQKEKDTSYYVHALAQASLRFGDVSWISDILNFAKTDLFGALAPAMIRALPPSQRNDFALRFIEVKPQEIVTVMTEQNEEWSHALAKEILKHTSSEIYLYNKNFYRAALALIPLSIAPELDSLGPSEEAKKPYWNNLAGELKRILELKKQVIQSF